MTTLFKPEKRLLAARKAAGFETGQSFAETYKIAVSTYHAHERGKDDGGRGLRRKAAENYAGLFEKHLPGITADWLLYGQGATPDGIDDPQQPVGPGDGPGIDERLLRRVITIMSAHIKKNGNKIPPEKLADVYFLAYDIVKDKEPEAVVDADFSNVFRLMF